MRRNPHWITLLLLVAGAWPLLFVIEASVQGDVSLYQRVADSLGAGEAPYRDRELEYPPYAIPIFLLPWLFAQSYPNGYQLAFSVLVAVADGAVKCLLLLEGSKQRDRFLGLLPLAMYCLSVPFIRYFYLQRYDIFPSLITIGVIGCFARGWFGWAGALLAIGAGMKLYPALLAPGLWILAVKDRRGVPFVTGGAVALIPLLLLSFSLPWWRFLMFHNERGLQVESLYASIIWLGMHLGVTHATWISAKAWLEVGGPLAEAVIPWAKCLMATITLFSVAFSTWIGSRCSGLTVYQIARLMLVPLLAFVAFNLVFSPQYMIWLLPLAALGLLGGKMWPMLVIAIATAVIPLFYPTSQYFAGLNLAQTIVLTCRNLSLVVVWFVLLREFWRMVGQPHAQPKSESAISA